MLLVAASLVLLGLRTVERCTVTQLLWWEYDTLLNKKGKSDEIHLRGGISKRVL